MSKVDDRRLVDFATVLQLEKLARRAATKAELGYCMANETFRLLPYTSGFFFEAHKNGKLELLTASGADSIDRSVPLVKWIETAANALAKQNKLHRMSLFGPSDMPDDIARNWKKHSPEFVLWCPLVCPKENRLLGGLWLAREKPWQASDTGLAELLADGYGAALSAFKPKRKRFLRLPRIRFRFAIVAVLLVLFIVPVRQSVIAPAAVIAKDAKFVTAPINGVIETVYVKPNQLVKKGDRLFSFDRTILQNRLEQARKTLKIAQAELKKTEQLAFTSMNDQANVALLRARIDEQAANADFAAEMLKKVDVYAPENGMVLFGDASDWIGRPVSIGEKVMTLANPEMAELEIWLPVADAIVLESRAPVRTFLNTDPFSPLDARISFTAVEPAISPEGIASYRLKAEFVKSHNLPRIGLKATAKLFGGRVSLFYFLFRRPLSALRQWIAL